jgi:hypothetical protein
VEATEQTKVWATYVRGRLVDRVAADGSLAAVAQPMGDSQAEVQPLFQQFPLTCSVADKLYKGWDTKVVAFRVSCCCCNVATALLLLLQRALGLFWSCCCQSWLLQF